MNTLRLSANSECKKRLWWVSGWVGEEGKGFIVGGSLGTL